MERRRKRRDEGKKRANGRKKMIENRESITLIIKKSFESWET